MATYELCINSFVGTHHDCSMCRNILRIGVTYTFYVLVCKYVVGKKL